LHGEAVTLVDDLRSKVADIFQSRWSDRDGQKVPEAEDLGLGNEAVKLEGTVLYADISESTQLVDGYKPYFAAEVYKAYLHCAAKLVREYGGAITAYDGDRIMAVYLGSYKNTSAVKTALKLNWARRHIINPAIKAQYPSVDFQLNHVLGIDTSDLWVTRTGVRGANDLVWIGRSANYAAKLTTLNHDWQSRITVDVYDTLNDEAKTSRDGRSMWERVTWNSMGGMTIYRSTWGWEIT
jgi:class 3 adenylate cyclase